MSLPNGESPLLTISGEFNIFNAQMLKEQIVAVLSEAEAGAVIDIDLVDVSEIDTAGLQLMLMAKREATAEGKTVHFVRHSDAVLDLIDLCDLAGQLGDPMLVRSPA